jgi:hypothetical protein
MIDMKNEKRMSHLRNVVEGIEDKGYLVSSIKYDGDQISVVIDNPYYAGNQAFLRKAAGQEGAAGIAGI